MGASPSPGERKPVVTVKTYAAPFVSSDAGALAGAVVLRPSASIDLLPPIQGEPSPISDRALEQHGILVTTLRDRGVAVHEVAPRSETRTESLIADAAILFPNGAVVTRPSQLERRAEIAVVEQQLADLGVPVLARIEAPGLLDAGDVALAPGRAFVGVPQPGGVRRPRSNELGRKQLEAVATAQGYRVVELAMNANVPRLRNIFSVVGGETAVAAPDWVDVVAVGGMRIVAVPRGEQYAAGVLAVGERRVIANLRFRESIAIMRRAKITVDAIDLWEFGKAGVGPFSLVLAVKRD